jgi:hypothetical protein
MKFRFAWLGAAIVLLLTGCVSPQSYVAPETAPSTTKGYVAGMFSGEGPNFGFGLVNIESKQEYLLPFYGQGFTIGAREERVRLIEVPAGDYVLEYWATFASLTNERLTRKNFSPQKIITVKPGRGTFIGRYATSSQRIPRAIRYEIKTLNIAREDFLKALKTHYPKFNGEQIDFPIEATLKYPSNPAWPFPAK